MSLIVIGVILSCLIVGLGFWLGYQLIRQNGRILLRLEVLEARLARLSTAPTDAGGSTHGLPIGVQAPAIELPTLDGSRMSLEQLRGQRIVIFFSPQCGYCREMAPVLAALPTDGHDGYPVPLIVSTGDREANRKLVEEFGIHCPVLLQHEMEVAALYHVTGTPMGYLIDQKGAIASELAVGSKALLALVTGARASGSGDKVREQEHVPARANGQSAHYSGNRSLLDSRINRNGLPAGTPAPNFRLARVDGGELSLEQYRGQRVLLVFSDPTCGPCSELAPELERLHRGAATPRILMVSRGGADTNRAKVAEHEITFPIVLQRHWEVSRAYGMFATPIAYLIDENGVIVADVAIGKDSILALASNVLPLVPRKEACLCAERIT